jgi:hypothetical protein
MNNALQPNPSPDQPNLQIHRQLLLKEMLSGRPDYKLLPGDYFTVPPRAEIQLSQNATFSQVADVIKKCAPYAYCGDVAAIQWLTSIVSQKECSSLIGNICKSSPDAWAHLIQTLFPTEENTGLRRVAESLERELPVHPSADQRLSLYMAYADAAASGDYIALNWITKKDTDPDYKATNSDFCESVRSTIADTADGPMDIGLSKAVGYSPVLAEFEDAANALDCAQENLPLAEVEVLDGGIFVGYTHNKITKLCGCGIDSIPTEMVVAGDDDSEIGVVVRTDGTEFFAVSGVISDEEIAKWIVENSKQMRSPNRTIKHIIAFLDVVPGLATMVAEAQNGQIGHAIRSGATVSRLSISRNVSDAQNRLRRSLEENRSERSELLDLASSGSITKVGFIGSHSFVALQQWDNFSGIPWDEYKQCRRLAEKARRILSSVVTRQKFRDLRKFGRQ